MIHFLFIRWFEEAAGVAPENALYHRKLGSVLSRQALSANILRQFFLIRSAKNALKTAVALAPDSLAYRMDLLNLYAQTPTVWGGSKSKALLQAEEIARRNPLDGFKARARVYVLREDFQTAEQVYREGINAYPGDPALYLLLEDLLVEQNRLAEALNVTTRGVEAVNRDKDLLFLEMGRLHIARGHYGLAMAALERAAGLNPTLFETYYLIGKAVSESDLPAHAGLKALETFLASEDGRDRLQRAWAYYRMGRIYQKNEQPAEAREAYRSCLALNPDHQQARSALANLANAANDPAP